MRTKYRQIDGVLVEIPNRPAANHSAMIQTDITPYASQITGEMITSRSHHRAHLKQHGAEEVGSEKPQFLKDSYEQRGDHPEWGRDGRRTG